MQKGRIFHRVPRELWILPGPITVTAAATAAAVLAAASASVLLVLPMLQYQIG